MTTTKRETQHTPGPWSAREIKSRETELVYVLIGHPHSLPTMHGVAFAGTYVKRGGVTAGRITDDECRANARLIAAAPELLEALERTSGALTGVLAAIERDAGRGPDVVYETLDEARVAIAKAKGE